MCETSLSRTFPFKRVLCFLLKNPTYSKNLQKKISHKSYFVSNVFFSKRHPTYSKNLQKKVSHKSYFVSNVLFLAQDIHIKQELMKIQANFKKSLSKCIHSRPEMRYIPSSNQLFFTSYMYPGSIKNKSRHIQDPIVNQELCFQNLYIKKRI